MDYVTARESLSTIVSDLKTINQYYPDSLEQAIGKFICSDPPTSVDEIKSYVGNILTEAFQRLVAQEKECFFDANDDEIEGMLIPLLREYFEKTPDKLIVKSSSKTRGEIRIHPLIAYFHKELGMSERGITNVTATYGSNSLSFKGVDCETAYVSLYELYISLHPEDFNELSEGSPLMFDKEGVCRADYDIKVDLASDSVIFNIRKPRFVPKPKVEALPVEITTSTAAKVELGQETGKEKMPTKRIAEVEPIEITHANAGGEPTNLVGEGRPSLETQVKEIREMLGDVRSNKVRLRLQNLSVELIKDHNDFALGSKIAALCEKLEEHVNKQRTLLEQESLEYAQKATDLLDEVSNKARLYASHVKRVER
jgi:hypothetical protein